MASIKGAPAPTHHPDWEAVDDFLVAHLLPADPALDAALAASTDAGLPPIAVAPTHGAFLHLLARLAGARRILEIGTLGGYSAIWLARALPADGVLVTLELDPRHAAVARANLAAAGVADRVTVREGAALDTLAALVAERVPPFDLVFIDADKANIPAYVARAIELARPGTLLVVDNVVRRGALLDAASTDPNVLGTRALFAQLAADPRLDATALQTVGHKGWDGLLLARVR
jgi:predicted O-methyltransferase YrrM